jgi:hypothetical protein
VGKISLVMTSCWSIRGLTPAKNHTDVRCATSSFHRGRAWTDILGHTRGRGPSNARYAPSASHCGNTSRDILAFVQHSRPLSYCMASLNADIFLCRNHKPVFILHIGLVQRECGNVHNGFPSCWMFPSPGAWNKNMEVLWHPLGITP